MQKSFPAVFSKKFIWFRCESIVNRLKGNLRKTKRHRMASIRDRVPLPNLKRTTWKQRKDFQAFEKVYRSFKFLLLRSLTIGLDMEHLFLVPASRCNKILNTEAVTKQELSMYQALQNPTYQIDSLKKWINKNIINQSRLLDKLKFVFSMHQALQLAIFFGWCTNWIFTVRFCPTFAL